MGTNEASKAPGAYTPSSATIGPRMAASEYAGDVEARPITIELTKPIAPGLRVASGDPLSRNGSDGGRPGGGVAAGGTAAGSVAIVSSTPDPEVHGFERFPASLRCDGDPHFC